MIESPPRMRVPFNYLDRQFDAAETDSILAKIRDLVSTGEFTIGPPVLEFERRLGEMLGVKHVIGVNCGTDSLILGLKALGIGPGDEVIIQVNTFYATAGAIVAVGAKPVFVDVDNQFAIDEWKIKSAITARTKAIMPVHLYGLPPNMPAIMEIARRRDLLVAEDSCQAPGARYNGIAAGAWGNVGGVSMHPLKPLHVWGDGGAVLTNDDAVAEWLGYYRNHGMSGRDEIVMWGVNARLQSIQAVVALHVLDRVEGWIDRRIEIARRLDEGLRDLPEITLPPRPPERRSAFTIYVIQAQRRDALIQYLAEWGVEAKVHYPIPLHLQPAARRLGYRRGDFPVAEAQAERIVTLPAHQFLADSEVDYLVEAVRRFYSQ